MPEQGIDAWVFRRAPLLGEHTFQALASWLEYSETQVSDLAEQGVIVQNGQEREGLAPCRRRRKDCP